MTFSEINRIGNGTSSSSEVINTIYAVNVYANLATTYIIKITNLRRQKGEGR